MYVSGIGGASALSSWSMLVYSFRGWLYNPLRSRTHHCNFIEEPLWDNPVASEPIIPTTFVAALATILATVPTSNPWPPVDGDELSDGFADTPTPNICADTPRSAGFSVTSRFSTVISEEKRLELACCASNLSQMWRIKSASLHSLFYGDKKISHVMIVA